MQFLPSRSAARTAVQCATDVGARHRRLPTGGAAYGTPRNTRTPLDESMEPARGPASIVTVGVDGCTPSRTTREWVAHAASAATRTQCLKMRVINGSTEAGSIVDQPDHILSRTRHSLRASASFGERIQ